MNGIWGTLVVIAALTVVSVAHAQDEGETGVAEAPPSAEQERAVERADEVAVAADEAAPPSEPSDAVAADEPPPPPPPPEEEDDAEGEGPSAPSPSAAGQIPIDFQIHGYYRARLGAWNGIPTTNPADTNQDLTANPAFGYMRLRLEPSITFGSNHEAPIAALRSQFDLLDNVVFGDNARLASTPLFAGDPSSTNIFGNDSPQIYLRRLWLEFAIPIGQIRIGRQGSHGGLGLLFNDGGTTAYGNTPDTSFRNDFGDANSGVTFDRIMYLTRPLTIINALTRGDSRPTPLIFALGYDWLVEDTLGSGAAIPGGPQAEMDYAAQQRLARSRTPYAFLGNGGDDVYQAITFLAWHDPDFNMTVNARDELTVGLVGVYRGQQYTSSDVWIGDAFYRIRWSPGGHDQPMLYSEGEIYTIQGTTNAVALTGASDYCNTAGGCTIHGQHVPEGRSLTQLGANIWGGAMRLGVESPTVPGSWQAFIFESGFSTGQNGRVMGINQLTQRPSDPNYQVGLLLYPVALAVRTADSYFYSTSLWSGGGVWNSIYFLPQLRWRPLGFDGGVELIGQFLVAFADQLNTVLTSNTTRACGVSDSCLMGYEADFAIKLSWGPHDEMRWSNEFGVMNAGPALAPMLSSSVMWTLQSRIAFSF